MGAVSWEGRPVCSFGPTDISAPSLPTVCPDESSGNLNVESGTLVSDCLAPEWVTLIIYTFILALGSQYACRPCPRKRQLFGM